jgi:hypothetical protein
MIGRATSRLAGLKPGTRYKYRVVSKEFSGYQEQHVVKFGETVASPVYQFTTLDPAKASFAFSVVSDIHEHTGDLESALGQNTYLLLIGTPDTVTRVDVSWDALKVTVTKIEGEKLDERVLSPSTPALPR